MRRRNKLVDRAIAALADASPAQRLALIRRLTLTLGAPRRSLPRRQIDRVFAVLARGLRADPDAAVREAIAYALTFWFERRSPRVLVPVLLDTSEATAVRAQAAEGIGNVLQCRRLTAVEHERIAAAMRIGLNDASVEVRFWCLYAVGNLRMAELRPLVEHRRDTDTSLCPHWWRVCDEASDALAYWDTGQWPDLDRRANPPAA